MRLKWKNIAACTLLISLLGGGSMLFADSFNDHVRVWFNGDEIKDGGYLIDNKIYIPARETEGAVAWDKKNGKVNILKPNVHIFLFKGDTAFGNVNRGKLKFNVFSQIDTLTEDIHAVKVAITDPTGKMKDIQSQDVKSKNSDNFWFRTNDFTYDFNSKGKYSVGFYIKTSSDSEFMKVAEKVITVLK